MNMWKKINNRLHWKKYPDCKPSKDGWYTVTMVRPLEMRYLGGKETLTRPTKGEEYQTYTMDLYYKVEFDTWTDMRVGRIFTAFDVFNGEDGSREFADNRFYNLTHRVIAWRKPVDPYIDEELTYYSTENRSDIYPAIF